MSIIYDFPKVDEMRQDGSPYRPSPLSSGSGSRRPDSPSRQRSAGQAPDTSGQANTFNASLSNIAPTLLEQLRQSFSYLDRSARSAITKPDLAAALAELGLPASDAALASYLPPGGPQQLPLAQYLSILGSSLSQLSREDELVNALSAFDDQDNGEIEQQLLIDALTDPESSDAMTESQAKTVLCGFSGKQAFGKQTRAHRADVFRYRDWLGEISGPPAAAKVT